MIQQSLSVKVFVTEHAFCFCQYVVIIAYHKNCLYEFLYM